MEFHELQVPEDARAYVLHGLRLMRAVRLQPAIVRPALEWMQQLASEGHPLPPSGFVADVGVIVAGMEHRLRSAAAASDWPNELARGYDDHVLSKLYADRSIDRAADALQRYGEHDRTKAVAFIVEGIRARLGIGGVTLGPAALKPLLDMSPASLVAAAWQTEVPDRIQQIVAAQYQELIAATRLAADLLGPEDLFELERGTAVSDLGQRVALRQIIRAASQLGDGMPSAPPMRSSRREAPTRMLDDDAYPVGGFSSISNRGSLESLLHSQLAYMEAATERPDLFDVKYLRDELLYYSRDENQFYRRRRHYVIVFTPDLAEARHKDARLPYQRIMLALATVVAAMRRLSEWLTDAALTFELVLPAGDALDAEKKLLATVCQEAIVGGSVTLTTLSAGHDWRALVAERERHGESITLIVSMREAGRENEQVLQIHDGPRLNSEEMPSDDAAEPMQQWANVLATLLNAWVGN